MNYRYVGDVSTIFCSRKITLPPTCMIAICSSRTCCFLKVFRLLWASHPHSVILDSNKFYKNQPFWFKRIAWSFFWETRQWERLPLCLYYSKIEYNVHGAVTGCLSSTLGGISSYFIMVEESRRFKVLYKGENKVSLISLSSMLEEAKIMLKTLKPGEQSGGDVSEVLVIPLFPDTPSCL